MKDNLLNTEEKQKVAVENARSFLAHPFWQTYKGIVDTNIQIIKNRLSTEEFKDVEEVKRLQDKIKAYEEVIGTPEMIIDAFDPADNGEVEGNPGDPYESIEQFR